MGRSRGAGFAPQEQEQAAQATQGFDFNDLRGMGDEMGLTDEQIDVALNPEYSHRMTQEEWLNSKHLSDADREIALANIEAGRNPSKGLSSALDKRPPGTLLGIEGNVVGHTQTQLAGLSQMTPEQREFAFRRGYVADEEFMKGLGKIGYREGGAEHLSEMSVPDAIKNIKNVGQSDSDLWGNVVQAGLIGLFSIMTGGAAAALGAPAAVAGAAGGAAGGVGKSLTNRFEGGIGTLAKNVGMGAGIGAITGGAASAIGGGAASAGQISTIQNPALRAGAIQATGSAALPSAAQTTGLGITDLFSAAKDIYGNPIVQTIKSGIQGGFQQTAAEEAGLDARRQASSLRQQGLASHISNQSAAAGSPSTPQTSQFAMQLPNNPFYDPDEDIASAQGDLI
jgi:hypothetical protein